MHFVVVEEVAGFLGAGNDALRRTAARLSGKAAARTGCAWRSETIVVGICFGDARGKRACRLDIMACTRFAATTGLETLASIFTNSVTTPHIRVGCTPISHRKVMVVTLTPALYDAC